MDQDLDEGIFRAMEEDNGLPKLGLNAVTLGVRKGVDIVPDQAGMVYRPAFRPGERNGLSCSPTIQTIPWFALPVEWGGPNKTTVIWRINAADLGLQLIAQDDSHSGRKRHISIGPSGPMTFDDFLRAVQATKTVWKKVISN